MSAPIVTTQSFTKQELDMIVQALEVKFDIDNDTSTEELWEMERQASTGYALTPTDIQTAAKQINDKIDKLLILQQLQSRLVQAQVDADSVVAG